MVMKNPNGLCQCGCGKATRLATSDHRKDGYEPGEPLRFINGHNAATRRSVADRLVRDRSGPPNPSGLCECGCGHGTALAPQTGRGYIKGDHLRFIDGHSGVGMNGRRELTGEDHPNWKTGRHSYRKRAIAHYGPSCMRCGYDTYLELIEVHHRNLKPASAQDDHSLENLLVLCIRCHAEMHLERTGRWGVRRLQQQVVDG